MGREQPILRAHEHWRRYRRISRRALLASVLFHALLFLIFRGSGMPPSPFAAAGPRAGDDRAAASGGGMQAVAIVAPPEPEPIPRPPAPVPVPDITVEVEELPEPQIQPVTLAEAPGFGGPERGLDSGPGRDDGTGRGDGGTAASGRFRVIPPAPRGLILPPSDPPGNVRGKQIAIWVFVSETGRVVPDSTRLQPPTGNASFDDRLRRQAAQWVFEPARRGGRPVAEWFRYEICAGC
jgi:hypothetical protein